MLALMSPFWIRVWIVQELASASSVVFQITHISFRLEHFLALWTAFGQTQALEYYSVSSLVKNFASGLGNRLGHMRAAGLITNKLELHTALQPAPLYELLIRWSDQRCTEPRDIIFGLLGNQ